MRFIVFGKAGCDACLQVKDKIERYINKKGLDEELERYDIETEEGLVEASMYDVSEIPTFMLIKDDGSKRKWVHGILYKELDEELAK